MMRTGASGMAAQSNRLATVADNIANVGTTGYKRASTEFSALVLQNSESNYVSGSVETTVRHFNTEQGGMNFTNSVTDMAISGNGFFAVIGPDNERYLTRAGSFVQDGEGRLINAAGFALLGYDIRGGDVTGLVNSTAALNEINLGDLSLDANPSTEGTFNTNLPATSAVVAAGDLPSANAATANPTGKSSLIVFDNIGQQVTLDVYASKTATNTWEIAVFDRADADATSGDFPYASAALATQTLDFDANGQLTGASATSIAIPVTNGATLTLDMSSTSELAADYTVIDASINGSGVGEPQSFDITSDGYFYAIYGDGSRVATHRIPLAIVESPDNLRPQAGGVYTVNADSGDLLVGFAGSNGGFGTIVANALEGSTVDLADELTAMIEAQRNYTANSKSFQTGADLLDVLVNLKR
ncbi:MAG: flagellar hook protein FlgE [Hyphomicrobiaceae bacterium]